MAEAGIFNFFVQIGHIINIKC